MKSTCNRQKDNWHIRTLRFALGLLQFPSYSMAAAGMANGHHLTALHLVVLPPQDSKFYLHKRQFKGSCLMQRGEGFSPLLMTAHCCVSHLFGWRQALFFLIIVSSCNLFQQALMLTTLHASSICKICHFIYFLRGEFCYNLFPPGELTMYSML